jgi:hypothetical protein
LAPIDSGRSLLWNKSGDVLWAARGPSSHVTATTIAFSRAGDRVFVASDD